MCSAKKKKTNRHQRERLYIDTPHHLTMTLTFLTAPDWTLTLAPAPPPRPAHGPRTDITSPRYRGQIISHPGPRRSLPSLASLCQGTEGGSLVDNSGRVDGKREGTPASAGTRGNWGGWQTARPRPPLPILLLFNLLREFVPVNVIKK